MERYTLYYYCLVKTARSVSALPLIAFICLSVFPTQFVSLWFPCCAGKDGSFQQEEKKTKTEFSGVKKRFTVLRCALICDCN